MLALANKLTLSTQPIYRFVNKYSIDFDGVDDRIITDGADTVAQNSTYSMWIKSSTTTENFGVFGHGRYNIGAFHLNSNDLYPMLYLGSNYWIKWNDSSAQEDGEWHHYVVYLATNLTDSKLYIDGVLQTKNTTLSSGSLEAYTESLTIGSDRQVGGNSFEGQIDEFAVYDRELTQDEITRMYNTYYSPNRVANGNFSQIGNEEVTNGDFSQEGSELVIDGDFPTGTTAWNTTNAPISNGKLNIHSTSGEYSGANQNVFIIGKQYKLDIDIEVLSGGVNLFSGSGSSLIAYITQSGQYTYYLTADGSDGLLILVRKASGDNVLVDNISVKEVGQGWTLNDSCFFTPIGINIKNTPNTGILTASGSSLLTIGSQYKMTYEITESNDGAIKLAAAVNESMVSTVGTHTKYFTADQGSIRFIREGTVVDVTINNISIKEVGQHWDFGTGWSTDGTKAIYTAGGSQYAQLEQIQGLNSGATYKVLLDLVDTDSLGVYIRLNSGGWSALVSGTGSKELSLVAGSGNEIEFEIGSGYATKSLTIDNIVVQELKHDATNLMLNAGAYQSANPLITSTKSMEFDGTDDYLDAGVLPDSFTTAYSLSAWIWTDDSLGNHQIFSTGQGALSQIYQIGTGLKLQILGGTGYQDVIDADYFDTAHQNTWVHLALVYNGATIKAYRNGIEVGSAALSGTLNSITNEANIGRWRGGSEYWNGKITEFGLYDRGLTALEVASLYNQGMPTNLLVNRNNYQSGNPTVFNTKQVDFDGTDDYATANNILSGSQAMTLSAWAKADTVGSSFEGVMLVGLSNVAAQSCFITVNQSRWYVGLWGTTFVDSSINAVAGEWAHIVYTYDGSSSGGAIKCYVNGVLSGTGTTTPNIQSTAQNSNADVKFGKLGGSGYYFDGQISQAGLWDKELTADEVSSLYNHGLPIDLSTDQAAYESSSNLVGYWRMGSGTLDSYPLIADQTNATLGSELVSCGDFACADPDAVWSRGTGITISGGSANFTGNANTFLTQSGVVSSGKTYKATFSVSNYISGAIDINLGGSTRQGNISADGSYVFYITVPSGNILYFQEDFSNGFVGSIDNVSVKQVNGNPAIMTNQTSSDIENGSPYANIVQQSDFANGDNWYEGTGCTISGGKAILTSAPSGSGFIGNNLNAGICTVGKTYKVTFTIDSISEGALKIRKPFNSSVQYTSAGTYSESVVAAETDIYIQNQGTTTATIDNVTVEEVNTGLQGYWKMGDGTNDEYPVIYDQTNPTLGSEVVLNSNFSSESNWDKDASWTIANNKANNDGSSGDIFQELTLEVGKNYVVRAIVDASFESSLSNTAFQIRKNSGGSSWVQLLSSLGQIEAGTVNYLYLTFNASETNSLLRVYSEDNISFYNPTIKEYFGNPATMTNMVEGNITNQYPLTKIRNYYRMGDGILDGYPIIQDQTSPNLAHIPTTNILVESEDFTSGIYSKTRCTITSNQAIAPNGTQTADLMTATDDDARLEEQVGSSGAEYTQSVYVKSAQVSDVDCQIDFAGLNAVTFTANQEWQRVQTTLKDTAYSPRFRLRILNDTNSVYVWGAQLEAQSQATAYIKSDGIAAVRKSTTTNLITYSEDFSQSYWTKTGSSVTSGFISPYGTATAYSLIEDTSTGVHLVKPPNSSFASNIYTLSVYAKYNGRVLQIASTSTGGHYANFDLLNGVIGNIGGSTANVTMTEISNGWYRCSMTTTSNMNTSVINTVQSATSVYQESYTGNGTSGIYIFGAQVEQQTQAETYAKTTGLPVTIYLFTENNYGTMTNMSASDIIEDTPNN